MRLPIQIDQPQWTGKRANVAGALDFTEATGVAIGNTITVLIRPIHSVMMWQCWSHDSGATWEPAVRAPFPGYAQYRGPVKGMYMCGGGTHPGGGVMAAPGANAAREILADLKRPNTVPENFGDD